LTSSWEIFQERIKAEMRKKFSEAVVEHSSNPRNTGGFDDANGYARVTGPCGDTMEIWLKVDGDTIVKAGFLSNGCGITIASGSMVTEMVKGKNTNDALIIGQQDVLDALGGLPEEKEHCALLASETLKAAVISSVQKQNHH
jgi:nitrogen fixation protein NifU and related proteins